MEPLCCHYPENVARFSTFGYYLSSSGQEWEVVQQTSLSRDMYPREEVRGGTRTLLLSLYLGETGHERTEQQYGEVVNINLVRDKKTGKSKGFCFLCYEDQRSTILAVDNFNGIKIKGRTIRVDHVANYRPPKESEDWDDVTRALHAKGCGVKTPPHTSSDSASEDEDVLVKKQKGKECSWQAGSQVDVPVVGSGGWSLRGEKVGETKEGTK
uniref:RRM domain-containing protein n=1 Tax=Zonotrichia albicollis TaxID=44394 RepID=A0A8D2N802_ZONAL